MNVTFRQLRLVLALSETGSVSGAARRLHVTQPTASMQLREVARAVGLPIYEVIGKKVMLTATGHALVRTARTIQDAWAAFEQDVDASRGLLRGQLKVAVVSTAKYFIPRLLGDFCHRHPEIDIALEVLNRDGVVARLRENRDDLYVMSMPPTGMRLVDQVFLPNPLVLIAPKSHALAGRKRLTLASLKAERFILRESGSGTRMAIDREFRRLRFAPTMKLELGSNEAIREAVAGGLGVAIVSRHALSGHANAVIELPVSGFPIESQWHLVYPRGKQLTPIAQVFREHLLETTQSRRPAA